MDALYIILSFVVYLAGLMFTGNLYEQLLPEKYSEALLVFLLAIFWPATYVGHLLYIIVYQVLRLIEAVGNLGTKLGKRIKG